MRRYGPVVVDVAKAEGAITQGRLALAEALPLLIKWLREKTTCRRDGWAGPGPRANVLQWQGFSLHGEVELQDIAKRAWMEWLAGDPSSVT